MISSLVLLFTGYFSDASAQTEPDTTIAEKQMADVVITAQFTPTDARNALLPVRVIDAATISRRGSLNLEELLSAEVNFQFKADPILGSGVTIRGIGGENVKVLIDGVPVVGRMNGNVDLSQIPVGQIARVEIIEGPMSILYGSNAAGGVINVITKKQPLGRVEAEVQSQLESIGIQQHNLRLGVRTGKFCIQANGNSYDFNGYPQNTRSITWNPKNQQGYGATIRYQLSDSTFISYSFQSFQEEIKNLGELRRLTFKPYAFDDYYHTDRLDHRLVAESWLNKKWLFQVNAGWNDFLRKKTSYRYDQENDTLAILNGQQDTNQFIAHSLRAVIGSQQSGFANWLFGVEGYQESGKGDRLLPPTDAANNQVAMAEIAAFASTRLSVGNRLLIQPALRYGYNTRYQHPVLPSLHVKYDLNSQFTLRGGYSRGFRSPALKELFINFIDLNHFIVGNPELKAEFSHTFTTRIDYHSNPSRTWTVNSSAELFYNQLYNRITLVQTDQAGLEYTYRNIADFSTKGGTVSFSLNHTGGSFIRINGSYTGSFDQNANLPDSVKFPHFAPALTAETSYRIKPLGTDLAFVYRFNGNTPAYFLTETGEVNAGTISAYHLLNFTATTRFWENRILLQVGVKNAFNWQTVTVSGSSVGGIHAGSDNSLPLQIGRSFFVKAAFQFSHWGK